MDSFKIQLFSIFNYFGEWTYSRKFGTRGKKKSNFVDRPFLKSQLSITDLVHFEKFFFNQPC